jgi:hypothetical protein
MRDVIRNGLLNRKVALGAGTLVAALGIGVAMQTFLSGPSLEETAAAPLVVDDITLTSTSAAALGAAGAPAPAASGLAPAPASIPAPAAPVQAAAPEPVALADPLPDPFPNSGASAPDAAPQRLAAARLEDADALSPDAPPRVGEAAAPLGCEIEMTSRALVAAMVAVEINAACLPDARFVLHHNGMMFSALTDAQGRSKLTVPALAENAVFIAAFDNGDGAMVQQTVTDLAAYGRAVVQWRGSTGLGLHAREFDAAYFSEGHVHRNAAGSLADAALGTAGVLLRFGAGPDPLMAEVYTFPVDAAAGDGRIALSVEAEITAENCGAPVEAQTLQLRREGGLQVQDLTLNMPDCAAAGDFLVLKNLLQDMTLAAR